MKGVTVYVVTIVLSLIPALPARAQDSTGGGFCFRGRPRPKCSSFMLMEFSSRRRLGAVPDVDPIMDLELGFMANVGRAGAVGGAMILGGGESTRVTGVGLRYRRWLSRRLGAEVGVALFSVCEPTGPNSCEKSRAGFRSQAGFTLSDLVGVTLVYDHTNAGSGRSGDVVWWSYPATSEWSAGVKFGSYAAPVVLLGLSALIAATW